MAKFYNAADQKLFEKYKFLPQEQYRLGLNLPTTPDPDPVVNQGIVNTNSFANSGGGNDFNPAGNMFGEGTAVSPVYGGNPITGGFDGGYGVDPVTGDLPNGGNIVDEFGTKGEVYSKGSFDSLKSEEEKKSFLSKMMNSFRQKTSSLPNWAKAGITAAGMINPFTAIPSLINKFGSGNGGPSYGIAGLTDQQKAMYNNLAASGYLYNTPGGMKTFDGKNFSQFDDKSIDNYFDSQINQINPKTGKPFGTISAYEDYLDEDPNKRKNLIKTLQFYKQAKKGADAFTDFSNITDPTVTSDIIDEVAITGNNDGGGGTPPGFGTTPEGNYTNQFDGGDPGQGQGNNEGNNEGNQNDNSPGSQGPGGSDEMGSFARGGRAGYFFGGRAGYAEGGAIYPRLGTLSSGVQSAEQQLQNINASLQKAESDLGSDSPSGGSSLAGGPSFTSNFQDANNQGPGSNLLFGGSMDQDSPSTAPTVPQEPGQPGGMFKDPVTGGGQPFYGPGGRPIGGGGPTPPQTLPDGTPYDPGFPRPGGGGLILNPGRPPGGGPTPPQTLPDGTPYNPGFPAPNIGSNNPAGPRPIGGGGSGITTLPDGTVYNPGRPLPPQQGVMPRPGPAIDPNNPLLQSGGGGRPPIGGGPSPYEGSMKTQEQFGANARFRNQEDFDNAYKDYTQKYQDYNKNNQGGGLLSGGGGRPLGGGNTPFDPRFAGTFNNGRPGNIRPALKPFPNLFDINKGLGSIL